MGIGKWNRFELIGVHVVPSGVGPMHSLCTVVQYSYSAPTRDVSAMVKMNV